VRGRCLESVDAFVLAGGLGTRVQPILGEIPKLLAPISGQPYLAHLVGWLKRFGAKRVIFGLGHRANAVIEYLQGNPGNGIELVVVVEPEPLGTAGAIRFVRARLQSDPVLVMNGDSLIDANLCEFLDCHRASTANGSILCTEVENAGRYGRVEIDREGRIERFVEKDAAFHGSALVNAGVYLLSATLLDRIAADAAISLERDVFQRMPPGSLAAFAGRFKFVDIGTPESFARAGSMFEARS
jgi:mannose-1-phosphate guanylyltransferase